jgi:tetratricopeptide (TPR) repeat protein
MRVLSYGTSLALAFALASGCAARGRTSSHSAAPTEAASTSAAAPESGSLSETIRKIRHLSATAKPKSGQEAVTSLESSDGAFAGELAALQTAPTADRYRRVAERYRESGVLDAAYRHFNRAVALDPRDAAAYEGLARVWRDWGLAELALGDAHRAVYFAPGRASARNTLGTVMQALGRQKEARDAYAYASLLDPQAAYAVNNLCYLSFVSGRIQDAIDGCSRALKLDPQLRAARNNLALAYAAAGRLDLARTHFLDAGDRASGLYNIGIAHLAAGDQPGALKAFDEASKARPTFAAARERAQQIRARLWQSRVVERAGDTPER